MGCFSSKKASNTADVNIYNQQKTIAAPTPYTSQTPTQITSNRTTREYSTPNKIVKPPVFQHKVTLQSVNSR